MSRVIAPKYQELYTWKLEPANQSLVIVATIPESLDPNSLAIDRHGRDIVCQFPGLLPFFAGRLSQNLDPNPTTQISDNLLILAFPMTSPEPMSIPIQGQTSAGAIDPMSAVLNAELSRAAGDDAAYNRYLEIAVEARLPMAMTVKILDLANDPSETAREQLMDLLGIACDVYNYPVAYEQRAAIEYKDKEIAEAMADFEKAAALGSTSAMICLAELYIEQAESHPEYVSKGLELFLKVNSIAPGHPFVLYNLAKLYLNGTGVEKDEKQARELYIRAREACDEVPVIPELEDVQRKTKERPIGKKENAVTEESKPWISYEVATGIIVVTSLIGAALWGFMRRRK